MLGSVLSSCTSEEITAEAYSHSVTAREDISYGATKRLVIRIRLNTNETPDKDRMISTAKQLWKKQSKKWDEVTIFMIYGKMKNFNFGAYASAEFNSSGDVKFETFADSYGFWEK